MVNDVPLPVKIQQHFEHVVHCTVLQVLAAAVYNPDYIQLKTYNYAAQMSFKALLMLCCIARQIAGDNNKHCITALV